MNPVVIYVIVGLVAGVGGYLFGMLDSKVTSKITKTGEPEVKVVPEVSAMSVIFDGDQNIIVKMEGKTVAPEALTPEQRDLIRKILFQMRPYVVADGAPAPVAAPAPQVPLPSAPAVAAPSVVIKAEPIKADIASSADYVFRKKPVTPVVSTATTMIEQIDEILQLQMEGTPLEGRKISMRDGADHSVEVVVGTEVYNGVGNVPYPEVQAAIREAIAAWEKKYDKAR